MGDAVDVSGNNSLVACFDFILSSKEWKSVARAWRILFRKIFRKLNVMEDYNDDIINRRVGHIAVKYGYDSILVWGGYTTCDSQTLLHEYWPTNEICLYSRPQRTWRIVKTSGQAPPLTSGATGVVFDQEFYVFFGFSHYTQNVFDANVDEDLDEIEQAQLATHFIELNTNNVFVLNLETLVWKKLKPSGPAPLKVDKASSWLHGSFIYIFGGFGPPPDQTRSDYPRFLQHELDPDTLQWGRLHTRGWTNQLVIYDTTTNSWQWPSVSGDIPSPRAAHSCASNSSGDVYLFGGRYGNIRLNDLYHLDLRGWSTVHWTMLTANVEVDIEDGSLPVGRSWHTLTLVDEQHAVLYGGYGQGSNPLGDCWFVNLCQKMPTSLSRWQRVRHLDKGDLLWHCAVALPHGQVYLLGGVQTDLLHRPLTEIEHPRRITVLEVSPPPLETLALEAAVKNYRVIKTSCDQLPTCLKACLEERRKKFIYDRDKTSI